MEMKKGGQILLICLTALILILPCLFTNLKPNQASEIDNRMLEEFPALNESFLENMNVYLEDRVGFRTELMTAYQTLCYRWLHYIPRPAYRVGKDGYIMVTWDLTTYQHLDVPESYIQNFSAYIKSLQQLCESRGIDFTFWFIPNKETIYPEKFPDGFYIKDQKNRTDRLMERMEALDVAVVNPKEMFLEEKQQVQFYNKKYDAGHWNPAGKFRGYCQLYEHLLQAHPEIGMLREDEFDHFTINAEYIENSRVRIDEPVPYYRIKEWPMEPQFDVFDSLEFISPESYHTRFVSTRENASTLPKVLMFCDSYTTYTDQYFVNHFSEVTMIHSYNLANIEYYISIFDPDVVILEAVERALGGDSTNRYAEEYMTKRFFSQSSLETPEGITYTAIEMTGKDLDYTTAEVYCPDSGKTYISVTGTLSTEIDRPGAMELAVGGKEYYPAFDENGGFHFLVDADDWNQGSEPVFLKFSPK